MDDDQVTLAPGSPIDGKYTLVRLIGRGGMGAVYEATDKGSGNAVAVKVLNARYCRIPEVVKRFHREAGLAASVGHDNICEVLDSGTCDDHTPYLVMPLLTGRPLSALLSDDASSFTENRIARIVDQTLSALGAAHEAGVVHRDMKPDNIFITDEGGSPDVVKILDFGVSKMVTSNPVSLYTKEGTVIGTPAYMAPEQARGIKSVDHRIDIYAMGVILYEIMTGTRPYGGASSKEILFKIIADPFLAPRRINPAISEAMEKVIIKAMAKDPHGRFSSAAQMRDAFKRAAGVASLPPTRETAAPTVANASGYGFSVFPTAKAPRSTPEPSPPSKRRAIWIAVGILTIVAMAVIIWVLIAWNREVPVVVPLTAPSRTNGP